MRVEGLEDGQKALGVTGRLEALQHPFSSSGPLVRVLGPVIEVTTLAVFGVGQQLSKSRSIASQFVGDDYLRLRVRPEQLPQETLGRSSVALSCNQNVKGVAVLVYRSPEVTTFSADVQEYLVEVPLIPWLY